MLENIVEIMVAPNNLLNPAAISSLNCSASTLFCESTLSLLQKMTKRVMKALSEISNKEFRGYYNLLENIKMIGMFILMHLIRIIPY